MNGKRQAVSCGGSWADSFPTYTFDVIPYDCFLHKGVAIIYSRGVAANRERGKFQHKP